MTSCGASLASATRNVDNTGNVTQVNVAGIPTACSGETLSVTLVGAANAALGSGSATVGSCGTTCSVDDHELRRNGLRGERHRLQLRG